MGQKSYLKATVERRERAAAHYADPTWWDHIFDLISSGKSTLTAITRHYDIPYTTTIEATEKSPELAAKLAAATGAYRVTARDRITAELDHIAYLNPAECFKRGWQLKDNEEMSESAMRAIKAVDHTETVTENGTTTKVRVQFHDKLEALRQLRDAHKDPDKDGEETNKVITKDFTGKQPYIPPDTTDAVEVPSVD